jgi:hypothetical protein
LSGDLEVVKRLQSEWEVRPFNSIEVVQLQESGQRCKDVLEGTEDLFTLKWGGTSNYIIKKFQAVKGRQVEKGGRLLHPDHWDSYDGQGSVV